MWPGCIFMSTPSISELIEPINEEPLDEFAL